MIKEPTVEARDFAGADTATVLASLHQVRDKMEDATNRAAAAAATLRSLIISMRPTGMLTVDQMGAAVGRDRNYIDTVWSGHGTVRDEEGRVVQTRVVRDDFPPSVRSGATRRLNKAADNLRMATAALVLARAGRDRTVAMAYAAKLPGLGPSAIAREVGIDRNHVGRIARRHGISPVHRAVTRNQYSA